MSREDSQMKIRLPDDLREKITAAAESGKRSLNAEIIARLEASFLLADEQESMNERITDLERIVNALHAAGIVTNWTPREPGRHIDRKMKPE